MAAPPRCSRRLAPPTVYVSPRSVPNVKGAELALAAGVDELTVTVSASAAYNEKNVRMSVDESLAAIGAICALAAEARVPVDVVVCCAFGSPYEGIAPAEVAALVRSSLDAGATRSPSPTRPASPRPGASGGARRAAGSGDRRRPAPARHARLGAR